MITSIDAENTFDKIQHLFMIKKKNKTSQKLGIAGNILNLKGINKPPTAITYVIMGD